MGSVLGFFRSVLWERAELQTFEGNQTKNILTKSDSGESEGLEERGETSPAPTGVRRRHCRSESDDKLEHREGHAAAVLENQMLVWGGAVTELGEKTRYMSSETIWSLNLTDIKVWSKRRANFKREVDVPIPSSASKIAVVSNRCIYHYGGIHPSQSELGSLAYTSNLHTLDPSTLEWRIVRRSSPWPHGRSGCGLCLLGDEGNRVLVVFGGRGDEIASLAPGASWIKATGVLHHEYNGFNNELWTFSLSKGM